MKTLMMLFAAGGLALGLVALTPAPADAGHGWRGGGHWNGGWRGGRGWRGPRYVNRGWGGPRYRGWRGGGWGGGGVRVWAPGVAISVGPRGCWQPGWGYVPCRRWGWGY